MTSMGGIVSTVLDFYSTLIIVYVLMSWFPVSGFFADVYNALANICEPYLGIFRRIIPPLGMVDISPIVAILVLSFVRSFAVGILGGF